MTYDFLALARKAADAAAVVLLAERPRVMAEGPSATKSSETDPVTAADEESQRIIGKIILDERRDDGILAEEKGLNRPGTTGWRWVVDPLDGTVNYIYGRDQWSVSIAVQDPDGVTVAGVVLAPTLGRTYTAARGQGSWLDGQRLTARPGTTLELAVVGTGFSYEADIRAAQAAVLSRVLPAVADIRRCGSAALDLADVASGRVDAFYENDLSEWDWAAGALLATEAGAVVEELPGPRWVRARGGRRCGHGRRNVRKSRRRIHSVHGNAISICVPQMLIAELSRAPANRPKAEGIC
jgi:myo-inositol-1(or 4)-monophosphatase